MGFFEKVKAGLAKTRNSMSAAWNAAVADFTGENEEFFDEYHKKYPERVIGFSEYGADGTPRGLCRARKLYYVTTAGGPYLPDFSYDCIRTLATGCFGIPETELIKAEMLDVEGYDAEELIREAIEKL